MTHINYNLPYIASRAESELESRRLGKPSGSDSTITLLVFLSEAAEGISLGYDVPTRIMGDVIAEYHHGIIPKKMIDIEDETERLYVQLSKYEKVKSQELEGLKRICRAIGRVSEHYKNSSDDSKEQLERSA